MMIKVVFIPADLVFEILGRLPVKSLLRFRSVCKLWRWIISDSYFIESHRIRSATRYDGNFLLTTTRSDSNFPLAPTTLFSMYQWEGEDCNAFSLGLCSSEISENINGLICLNNGQQPQVWNLSTRESVILPPSSRLGFSKSRCSLGFDPCSNTYKIFRTIFHQPFSRKFEILTLGSKTWREVAGDSYNFRIVPNLHSVCAGGSLYWSGTRTLSNRISAFGLAEERFRVVLPPRGWTVNSSLAALDGRLAAVDYRSLMSGNTMHIWILEEDDDDENGVWRIKQSILLSSFWKEVRSGVRLVSLGFPLRLFGAVKTTNGNVFTIVPESVSAAQAYNIYVSFCQMERKSFSVKLLRKTREVLGMNLTLCPVHYCNYVESLVSLKEIINSYKP